MTERVILQPDDEAAFLAYCDASPDETIWLRSAWYDGDTRFAAARRDGRIVAIAAQDRRGFVHVHAGECLAELARECLQADLVINGVAGKPEQVEAARAALGLLERETRWVSREIQMALDLDDLVVPPGTVVRRAGREDLALLLEWYGGFFREMHGMPLGDQAALEMMQLLKLGRIWLLLDEQTVVNAVCFGAVFPDILLVEWSYSPRAIRTKGYGRGGVAGALLEARKQGVKRAVFNTREDNFAVQGAVHPVGFRTVGRYWVWALA